jgi:hypothetical protein
MEYQLIQEIIKRSVYKTWDLAKTEWTIDSVYYSNKYKKCLCGHYPIKEVIILENVNNQEKVIIGNCCVNKFFGEKKYNKYFKAIKEGKINEMVIKVSYDKKIINEVEYNFLTNTWRKRSLTEKQFDWFQYLKNKIISQLS